MTGDNIKNNTKFELIISNGKIVTQEGLLKRDIAINNGKISMILPKKHNKNAERIVEAENCIILPGVIDIHTHFCKPGPNNFKSDFYIETKAAAAGGITSVIEMPLSIPPVIDKKSFNLKYETHKNSSFVDFAFWGALTPYSIENAIDELIDAGCVGFKGFMAPHDKYQNLNNGQLWKAMNILSEKGSLMAIHAEDEDLIKYFTEESRNFDGFNGGLSYAKSRPIVSEVEAVRRVVYFGKKTGCKIHIVHLSSAEGASVIKEAKDYGINISAETCPHYLTLNEKILEEKGIFAKCEPPLRDLSNIEKLWEYIKDGTIDILASDHSSFTDSQRMAYGDNIWKAPPGLAGLEIMLPLIIDEGYHKRNLTWSKIWEITSLNAAKRLGIYPKKGIIKEGSDADLIIIDPDKEWIYSGSDSLSKTRSINTPYEKRNIKGYIKETILRGKSIYQNPNIVAKKPSGKYLI